MWDSKQRKAIFELLKSALKVRKKTYKELAQYLGTSELTIKRLFRDQDCKISRLIEICKFLGIDLNTLMNMQGRQNNYPKYLPEVTEKKLASDPVIFGVFLLIISNLSKSDIAHVTQLSESEFYLVLRQLEKLELINLEQNNQFHIKVSMPIAWRLQGHLAKALKEINQRYLAYCFDNENQPEHTYTSNSRLMSSSSAELVSQKINEIRTYFHYLATQDQLFYPVEQLTVYKLQIAHSPLPIKEVIFSNKLLNHKI